MRILAFLAVSVALALAAPCGAQMAINAPPGWTAQTRGQGATTFSPPDLRAGEKYSTTVYDSAPLEGKTLEEWLRGFAGTVSKAPGHLAAPLQIKVSEGRIVSGFGVYNGPKGTALGAMFLGVSLDGGGNVHASRTLFSGQDGLLDRYKDTQSQLMSELVARAKGEAGSNLQSTPPEVTGRMRPGGELVPGVYAGNMFHNQELVRRLRVYVYASGEYRLTNENDEDVKDRWGDVKVGKTSYNRNSGKLNIDWTFGLGNNYDENEIFCYYGRSAAGKPMIYAEDTIGYNTVVSLVYDGPPTKRPSPSQEAAQEAAATAEKNRFKWVVKPGHGVQNAQIATILYNTSFNGQSSSTDVYLLLKDGSVYADLPVAPDELDVQKSKQKEPDKWGKWRKGVKSNYLVSWNGGTYERLPGAPSVPAPSQTRLAGRFGTGTSSTGFVSSYALWGVTFSGGGRFKKDSHGGSSSIGLPDVNGDVAMTSSGYDENGSYAGASGPGYAIASEKKKNPNGNREGDYSLSGYVLTLRYDNGQVARLPFFFGDALRKTIYFEGSTMSKDEK